MSPRLLVTFICFFRLVFYPVIHLFLREFVAMPLIYKEQKKLDQIGKTSPSNTLMTEKSTNRETNLPLLKSIMFTLEKS